MEILATVSPGFFETVFLIYCIAWEYVFQGQGQPRGTERLAVLVLKVWLCGDIGGAM